jgi:hypothetical protein
MEVRGGIVGSEWGIHEAHERECSARSSSTVPEREGREVMKALMLILGLVVMTGPVATGQAEDPSGAVFMIRTTDHDAQNGKVQTHGYGTAFFISKDGTALTAGHLVSSFSKDPKKYRIIAVVGKEFYDTQLVCATFPPSTPDGMGHTISPMARDIAEIKLIPSTAFDGKKDTIFYFPKSGDPIPLATAHLGSLPDFPYLPIGGQAKGHVRVIGFGDISAIPHIWTADEQVEDLYGPLRASRDGTPFFGLYSDHPATYGDSGAPVVNDQNQVVGIMDKLAPQDRRHGAAEASSVLLNPCK